MSDAHPTGVLLTAFGGPDSIDAVGPFMARLMGREPAPEIVVRAQRKYAAIGGASPLPAIAGSIARALEERMSSSGHNVVVRVGMRYWRPYIAEVVGELAALGCEGVVMVSLSPFESKVSCGAYRAAAHEAVSGLTITSLCETGSLSATEGFRAHHAAELRRALGQAAVGSPLVVMTAHSLPESDLEQADPYVTGLRQVADAVAEHAGLEVGSERDGVAGLAGIEAWGSGATGAPWVLAYQSKGVRPGAWLAPDIDDVMRAGAEAGHTKVILVPIGFATDHMETMYDLDVVAEAKARDLGIDFVRTAVPNDNELLISALEQLVEQHL